MSRPSPTSCSAGKTDFTKNWQSRSNTPDSMGTCQKLATQYPRNMKSLLFLWAVFLLLSAVAVQLHAEQSDADSKLLGEICGRADKGDAQFQFELGAAFLF